MRQKSLTFLQHFLIDYRHRHFGNMVGVFKNVYSQKKPKKFTTIIKTEYDILHP